MAFLYPAKSVSKYNIAGKELLLIGEEHLNQVQRQGPNVTYVWDFINTKENEGYNINLELAPDFHKNAEHIMKFLASASIREVLKNMKRKNKLNAVKGIDARRRGDFFGIFGDDNIQSYFFVKAPQTGEVNVWQFLIVFDNMMKFANKHFYKGNIQKLLENINGDMLKQLFAAHTIIDQHSHYLRDIILKDSKTKPEGYIYKFNGIPKLMVGTNYPFQFMQIIDGYIKFGLIFTDILTIVELLNAPGKKQLLLIGETHAKNIRYFLQDYMVYPYKHPKMSKKDLKMIGKEINKNQVYLKYFN